MGKLRTLILCVKRPERRGSVASNMKLPVLSSDSAYSSKDQSKSSMLVKSTSSVQTPVKWLGFAGVLRLASSAASSCAPGAPTWTTRAFSLCLTELEVMLEFMPTSSPGEQ